MRLAHRSVARLILLVSGALMTMLVVVASASAATLMTMPGQLPGTAITTGAVATTLGFILALGIPLLSLILGVVFNRSVAGARIETLPSREERERMRRAA